MSPASRPVTVALIEDHPATRAAIQQALGDHPERVVVTVTCPDASTCLSMLRTRSVDVALVDLGLPDLPGTVLIRELAERKPALRSIAFTAFDDDSTVLEAVHAGAHGYLLKDEPSERIVRAIEEAAEGAHPISSRVAGYLLTHARRAPPPISLSDREEELAIALASGHSYAECAQRMGIALGTVQDYVKRVYRKLDINSKRDLREWVSRYATSK